MTPVRPMQWWERLALVICSGLLIVAAVCTGAFSKKAGEKSKPTGSSTTVIIKPEHPAPDQGSDRAPPAQLYKLQGGGGRT